MANAYAYAANNPIRLIDPSGESVEGNIMIIFGGVVFAAGLATIPTGGEAFMWIGAAMILSGVGINEIDDGSDDTDNESSD